MNFKKIWIALFCLSTIFLVGIREIAAQAPPGTPEWLKELNARDLETRKALERAEKALAEALKISDDAAKIYIDSIIPKSRELISIYEEKKRLLLQEIRQEATVAIFNNKSEEEKNVYLRLIKMLDDDVNFSSAKESLNESEKKFIKSIKMEKLTDKDLYFQAGKTHYKNAEVYIDNCKNIVESAERILGETYKLVNP